MNCPSCAHPNRPGAKFCEECAAPLSRACASCGSELRPSAKFCDECGTAVGAPAAPRKSESSDARKVVTIVFADLVGSTALHERLDPESARRFMEGYYAAMRGAVESHGGTVTQFLGDGVKAVFGIPRVAEDDANRAVRAAVAMQTAFRALAEPQREAIGKTGLRVAVNTGEVVANDASEIIGDPVNVAARLQEQGRDGDVVIGETTERLVGGLVTLELLGSFALKGRTEAVSAYRVTSLERPVGAAAAPFVGRDDELARILSVYDTAIEKPATALAVLLGSPGLGKSRLIEEFARRLGDGATWVHARCDAAGGATFAPLADALRALPELDAAVPGSEAERTRILDGVRALLAGSPASPEETFFVVRRLLAALAASKPVVLVIDDVHWAEPLLLDLIEHLVQWGSGVPLLVLVGARPELREVRSTLVTPGGLVSEVVTLAGLDAGAAMRLAANVIGAADLPASVAAKVLATSEGNPLFVGELVRMLVHEGALRREGERWTAGTSLAALEMPPTIHALLAARIERLRPEERIVLERAAVIGRSFSRSAVAELLSRDVADLDARLESLRRAELIERDSGWFLGEPVLRFHHVLIRDAAYRRILKGTRAELHARFADWVEARAGDSLEHEETIGWHLEQAHQHLRELGPIDAPGRTLGERAAAHLAAAGRRALARDDVPLASGLLGRALDRLDRDDAARAELALDWCEALLAAGDVAPATAALEELDRFAASDARLRAWHTCFASQLKVLTAPSGLSEAAESVAAAARELGELGDVAGEAKAHFVHAQAFQRLGKVGACEAALDRALAAARRAGDRRRANTVLAVAPLAALWGPSPVTRASGRCLDVVRVLRITQGAPAVEAVALSCQGVLEALRGRTDAARRMIASARKMVEELGITQRLLEADVFAARIDLLDGDAAAAEVRLRGAYEGMRELGLGIDAARAAALLARALLVLGRAPEAEALTHESERLAGDDLQAAIAWRGARAEALARRGETVAAVELASKAVEIAAATDALLDHADARLALATALREAGRSEEADTEERRATELWEAKGATLLAERARRERTPPAPPPRATVAAAGSARRRIRANRATAVGSRIEAAIAARDSAALEGSMADPCVVVHHPTGVTYGRREQLSTWKSIFKAEHFIYRREVLATLGDSLELWRHWISLSGLTDRYAVSFGLSDFEEIVLGECDAHGRDARFEIFASDQLGSAMARMFERHAELLPDESERARATAIARGAHVMLGQPDLASTAAILAPDVEFSDLRTVGFGTLRGAESVLQTIAAMMELSREDSARIDDVLALERDALVVRWTNRGTQVESGGTFERHLCQLFRFDDSGLLSRWQQFEAEHDSAALARFDALVAGAAPRRPVTRRVQPNAASEAMARFEAAFAARDIAALEALLAPSHSVVDHANGASYGVEAELSTLRTLMQSPDTRWLSVPVATLGGVLSLSHRSVSGRGRRDGRFDVAEYEFEAFVIGEVDLEGRFQRLEVFGADHLGEALARLYERHAELLPDYAERTRAAAIARSFAALLGPPDLDRIASALAPSIETHDHKLLGYGRARGAENVLRSIRVQTETADEIAPRVDAVLALHSHALVVRRTVGGVIRESGGRYEKEMLSVYACGEDGLVSRWEQFDPGREAEALARFDALVGGEAAERESPFANAARRSFQTFSRAWTARDWKAVEDTFSPAVRMDDRRRMVRLQLGADDYFTQLRMLFDQPGGRWEQSLIATRGDRLALSRGVFYAEVEGGGGPLEFAESFGVSETGADGRLVALVVFDPEDREAAYAELDERFDAGEGAAHARTLAAWRRRERAWAIRDWHDLSASAPGSFRDHRLLGWGTSPRRDWVSADQINRSLVDLAPDMHRRHDHVRLCERGLLVQTAQVGTRDGGAFEIVFLAVYEWDAQGRCQATDNYDVDRFDLARARFDALSEVGAIEPPTERFANAATRSDATLLRCFNTRDWEGVLACAAPELVFDERRRMTRNTCDRDVWLEQFRFMFDVPSSRFTTKLVATRGERLSLNLHCFEGEVADGGGPLAMEDHFALHEVDREGRIVAIVLFDHNDLDAAHAELDARFDAGEGAAHARGIATARARQRAFENRDWDAWGALVSPDYRYRDHRLLGWGTRDTPAPAEIARSLVKLAPDVRQRLDHLRLCERGALQQITNLGTRDGGAFEIVFVAVTEIDANGQLLCNDTYDVDRAELAWARFDELRTATPAPFANTASRANFEMNRCFNARDWAGIERLASPNLEFDERRRLVRNTCGREVWLEQFRVLFDLPASRFTTRPLATRGERLSLNLDGFAGEVADGGGPLELEDHLVLLEVDAGGSIVRMVLFDQGDLDAAYAELDARYEAGEDKLHAVHATIMRPFARATETGDWTPLLALCAPTVVEHDHRSLAVLGTTRGAEAWLANFRVLGELAPDSRYRVDHFRSNARGLCSVGVWHGTREGGSYEIPLVAVLELDEQKRIARGDIYDADQLEPARARFDELAAAARAPARFENVASRAWRQVCEAWTQRDMERFARLHPPALRYRDHRRMFQLDLDREQFLEFSRPLLQLGAGRQSLELIATRGEWLALFRHTMEMEGDEVGPSAIDSLMAVETASGGEIVAYERFDVDDLDTAYAELDARLAAGEARLNVRASAWVAEFQHAFTARDWDAFRALYARDLVCHDHRVLGWGTLHGVAEFVRIQEALIELAPDTRWRDHHVAILPRGRFQASLLYGTRDGGEFELAFLRVTELDAQGKGCRIDIYDPDRVDEARARFDEIRGTQERQALAAFSKSNAASAAMELWKEAFGIAIATDEWETMRARCAPAMVFDDRRWLAQISGDRELMIASTRERVAMGARSESTTIGTAGDRIAILRVLWSGGPRDGRFEVEHLAVCEVDACGLISAIALFDIDHARAAQREAWARWAVNEPDVAANLALLSRAGDAFNAHDLAAYRDVLADDLRVVDHRRTGLGRLEGADPFLASATALWELAPGTQIEFGWQWPAYGRQGFLTVLKRHGTLADGGEYESEYLQLFVHARGRFTHIEMFELEDLDAALVRFEELRPDPLRVPENAAARHVLARMLAEGDEKTLRALMSDDFCFDDRGRRALVRGGVEEWLSSIRFLISETGAQDQIELLATAGDRLALHHVTWRETPGHPSFRIDRYRLTEIDAAGKARAVVLFDADQRADASDELFERWVTSGADGVPTSEIEFLRAWNAHDLGRMRAVLPDAFVHDDRRRAGLGRVEGADAYVASAAALFELSPDVRIEELYRVAGAKHARVSVVRRFGINTEGGQAEAYFIRLPRFQGERLVGVDAFELDDMAAALARFEALRPDPLRIPPNAATRLSDRAALAIAAGDRASLRACASRDFRFEDHGKRALVVGDVDVWLDSALFLGSERGARLEPELLATLGDRIAVYRDAWSGSTEGGTFELGGVRVFELDATGKLQALLLFDSDDRAAAFAEATRRFASGEGAGCVGVEQLAAFVRALNERDWDALRATYTPDFVLTDQRPLGLGVLDLDAWVASLQATVELSVGLTFEIVRVLAWNERGVVVVLRRYGSIADGGGPFENFPIGVALNRGNGIERYELFEEADAERALARFRELTQA